MNYLVAGYKDCKSCIVDEVDCTPSTHGMSTQSVAERNLRNVP